MSSADTDIACPDCGENSFYTLADKRYKCRQCRKKFTPTIKSFRIGGETQALIISFFMDDVSAESTAQHLKINRKTIQKYYRYIRRKIARDCETYEDSLFFKQGKRIDNLRETSFCVSEVNKRIMIFSKTKLENILAEGHMLPIYFCIDALQKEKTKVYEIFIRPGTTQQNETATKFRSFFLKSLAGMNINNFNYIYYQLKEIEYKYNKANNVNDLLNLESIIN